MMIVYEILCRTCEQTFDILEKKPTEQEEQEPCECGGKIEVVAVEFPH